jgi:hypothetical protein
LFRRISKINTVPAGQYVNRIRNSKRKKKPQRGVTLIETRIQKEKKAPEGRNVNRNGNSIEKKSPSGATSQ